MEKERKNELKRVWDNSKIILKKMKEVGVKMGESFEDSLKKLETKEDLNGSKDFNFNEFIRKLPD